MEVGEGGSGLEEGRKEGSRGMGGGGEVVSTLRMEVRRSRVTHTREGWRHQQGRGSGYIVAGGLSRRMGGRENEAGGCVCRERKTFT